MPTLSRRVTDADDDVQHHRGTFHHFHTTGAIGISFAVGNASALEKQISSTARFLDITVPQGAQIITASLIIVSRLARADTVCRAAVFAEGSDNAAQITDDAEWHTARGNKTTAQVAWEIPVFLGGAEVHTSPDISSVIEEVINRPAWMSGNAINIFLDDEDDLSDLAALRTCWDFDGNPAVAPLLEIVYETVGSSTGVAGGFGTGINVAPGRRAAY